MPSPEEVEDAIARLEPLVVVQGERDPETWDEFVKRQLDEEEPRAEALRTLISAARSAEGMREALGERLPVARCRSCGRVQIAGLYHAHSPANPGRPWEWRDDEPTCYGPVEGLIATLPHEHSESPEETG